MNIDAIRAAAQRLDGHAVRTPLLQSPYLDEIAGRRVLIKAEPLQKTGSFKFRGAWAAVSALDPDLRAKGVIAVSSGNHAQGVALAAQQHECPAVIVMPSDAPQVKIANTQSYGADVILYDRAHDDRDAIVAELAQSRHLTLIKPFDNPMVIAGQGTTGLEIAQDAPDLKADLLVCCGGGGLSSGIALAVAADAPGLRVRPVEPEGFDDVARSLISGRIERNATTTGSICDAIISPSPGVLTFPILHRLCGPGLVVPDIDCERAMVQAFSRLKLVLEPGGAIALAAALYHGDHIEGDTVIAVASGGNVDPATFADILQRHS